jgi:hypothetical protein
MQADRWLQILKKPALSINKVRSDKAGFSKTFFHFTEKVIIKKTIILTLIFNTKKGFNISNNIMQMKIRYWYLKPNLN